jgi:hypothetical protein
LHAEKQLLAQPNVGVESVPLCHVQQQSHQHTAASSCPTKCVTNVRSPHASQGATPKQVESLVSGYQRLVDTAPGGMGGAYLAMAITQKGLHAPVGFEEVPQ